MKRTSKDLHHLIEPLLLFTVFFLPGYITQGRPIDPELFNNVDFNITYIISSLPQIALLLYIILIGQTESQSDTSELSTIHPTEITNNAAAKLEQYFISPFKMSDLLKAGVAAGGIYFLLLLVSFLGTVFFPESSHALKNPVQWSVGNSRVIPLVFLTCLVTGYREELFFRSYIIKRGIMSGLSIAVSIFLSALFFSIGHLYQGILGFIGTFLIGLYFAVIFIKTKNLHIIAIAHGIFNFANLLFSTIR